MSKPSTVRVGGMFVSKNGLSPISWMVIMLVAAFAAKHYLPSFPLSYFSTYFHELGHGLMSVFLGGEIVSIEVNYAGDGVCWHRTPEHLRGYVAFAGYAATPIFGSIFFLLGLSVSRGHHSKLYWCSVLLIISMLLVGLVKFHDMDTEIILLCMSVVIAVALYWPAIGHVFMKFIGTYMMIDAFANASWLFSYDTQGDHYSLEQITGIGMQVWIYVWFVWSALMLNFTLLAMYWVSKRQNKAQSKEDDFALKLEAYRAQKSL
ncbi:M50 family metallopeptidase [Neptuniibacter sp. QD37_11]|uniref:M50 family metallopeptidase n=1 Tax=Neptuniibacter sp. QD37_11 TaxID=3398209 RepID=UPI0039F54852